MVAILNVWDKPNYDGSDHQFDDSIADLGTLNHHLGGNWNDEICSIEVISGEWEVFEDINYGGRGVVVRAGTKGTVDRLKPPILQNWISSIRKISD